MRGGWLFLPQLLGGGFLAYNLMNKQYKKQYRKIIIAFLLKMLIPISILLVLFNNYSRNREMLIDRYEKDITIVEEIKKGEFYKDEKGNKKPIYQEVKKHNVDKKLIADIEEKLAYIILVLFFYIFYLIPIILIKNEKIEKLKREFNIAW